MFIKDWYRVPRIQVLPSPARLDQSSQIHGRSGLSYRYLPRYVTAWIDRTSRVLQVWLGSRESSTIHAPWTSLLHDKWLCLFEPEGKQTPSGSYGERSECTEKGCTRFGERKRFICGIPGLEMTAEKAQGMVGIIVNSKPKRPKHTFVCLRTEEKTKAMIYRLYPTPDR
ncbi:uncharacterized protein BDV17DRAFT_59226 [Aspergillus undulatus]|uniref:uncharacterized protein n=1 Tax=Aspergillus undulatus TaxID=1810928 RepID=UPI003CCD2E6C